MAHLNCHLWATVNNKRTNIWDPIEKIIVKYQFRSSILIIKNKIKNTNIFRFKHVMISHIKNEIKGLNPNKATKHNNIPPKILSHLVVQVLKSLQTLCSYFLITQYQTVSFLKI